MKKMLKPTGLLLVGAIFIFSCLMLNALGSEAGLPDLQKEMKKTLSGTMDKPYGSAIGKFKVNGETITLPWSVRSTSALRSKALFLWPLPSREDIALNETGSKRVVSDLTAINTDREREIIYDGSQDCDAGSEDLSNSLEISVTGQETDDRSLNWHDGHVAADSIERAVDKALNRDNKNDLNSNNVTRSGSAALLGNNMVIDVSGISVSAINSVKGGSATATSNILIRPVQIIACPSEVEEKLR